MAIQIVNDEKQHLYFQAIYGIQLYKNVHIMRPDF